MPARRKIYQHAAMDAGITLGDGETLKAVHVIRGGSTYGRVLFTDTEPMVLVTGNGVTVSHCVFEDLNGTRGEAHVPFSRPAPTLI